MAKNVVFTSRTITGEFVKTNNTFLKYPYLYSLTNSGLVYRLNVINMVGELYGSINLPYPLVGNSYTENGDYMYFTCYYDEIKIYRILLDTLSVEYINSKIRTDYVTDTADSVVKLFTKFYIENDSLKYVASYIISRRSLTGSRHIYYGYSTQDRAEETDSLAGDYFPESMPIVTDVAQKRLLYGYGYNYINTLNVGFTENTRPTSNYSYNNYGYSNVSVFDFADYYWAVGGSFYPSTDTVGINKNIIRIDKFSLNSNKYSTVDNLDNNKVPSVATTEQNAYILCSDSLIVVGSIEEFDLTYRFYSTNDAYHEVTNRLPINNLNVSYDGSYISVILKYIDGSIETVAYPLDTGGDYFAGLSTKPNAKRPNILLGDNSVRLYSNTSFYPVIVKQLNPDTVFAVNLYKNSAEANRVDKTNYLTAVGLLNGVMREGSSITDLSITFEMDTLPQFNYVYIPAFNRYYYVEDISTVRYNLWEMSLTVDALMSYRDAILNCSAFIDRNEFTTNSLIPDKKRVIEQGVDIQVIEGSNNLFHTNGKTGGWYYVLNGYKLNAAPIEPPEKE